jgi:hypothetical protein
MLPRKFNSKQRQQMSVGWALSGVGETEAKNPLTIDSRRD